MINPRIFGVFALLITSICQGLTACGDSTSQSSVQAPQQQVQTGQTQSAKEWWGASQGVPIASNLLATNELLLLDNSTSMNSGGCAGGKSRYQAARDALANHIEKSPPETNQALEIFDGSSGRVIVPFGTGPEHTKLLLNALASVRVDQDTPLNGSLKVGFDAIKAQAALQLGYGTYRIIVVTDGEWNRSGDPAPLAKEIVGASPAELHVIGFCTGSSHSLNIPGITRFYTADNPAALAKGLEAAQAETQVFDASTFSQ